jgi:hypothetical protein
MKSAVKSALIIAGALVAIIVIVVVVLQFASDRLHDDPEETLNFAMTARTFHDMLDAGLLPDVTVLADRIAGDVSDNTSELEALVMQRRLEAQGYRYQFLWLQPTAGTLDLYSELRQEATAVMSCYSRLYAALSERLAGNEGLAAERLEEARQAQQQALDLRRQNTAALEEAIAAARARLED